MNNGEEQQQQQLGRKRQAAEQLRSDRAGCRNDDGNNAGDDNEDDSVLDRQPRDDAEVFETTPQIASAEEMAKRTILRATRRPVTATLNAAVALQGGGATTAAAAAAAPVSSTGGFFKHLAVTGTASATATTAAAAEAKTPAAPLFSFGATSATPSFAFHAARPSDATTAPTTETSAAAAGGKDGATPPTQQPLFGAGAFNFGNAVNTFVEARKRMEEELRQRQEEQQKQAPSATTTTTPHGHDNRGDERKDSDEVSGDDADDQTNSASAATTMAVAAAPGEVLASAPVKLFVLVKGDGAAASAGQWVERGVGEAKLKRQGLAQNAPSATTTTTTTTATTPPSSSSDAGETAAPAVYRLLVRDGYSLNLTLHKKAVVLLRREPKLILFSAITGAAVTPTTYLLRFTGAASETNAAAFATALQNAIDAVNGASDDAATGATTTTSAGTSSA